MTTIRPPRPLLLALALAALAVCAIPAGARAGSPESPAAPAATPSALAQARAQARAQASLDGLAEELWQWMLDDYPELRFKEGLPVTRLPAVSYEHARANAEWAQGLLERLAAIDPAPFDAAGDHERWLTHRVMRWQARQLVGALPHFWNTFQVTPYASGFGSLLALFSQLPVTTPEERESYLDLLRQAAANAHQLAANLATRREKGILLPQPEIPLVEAVFGRLTQPPESHPLRIAPDRVADLGPEVAKAFAARVDEVLASEVAPAAAGLLAVLDDGYRAEAPAGVGIGQYPGGPDAYRFLVAYHTTLDDLTPEEIHRRGLAEVARIDAEMAELRKLLTGDDPPPSAAEFHRSLRSDPRFLACSPEGVEERLLRPIRRIEPMVDQWFAQKPKAPYGVARLDPALEGGMTFGFYDWPTPAEPVGRYYYNGSSLDQRPLVQAAALIYHELIPGHHFQVSLQTENRSLPDFRRNDFATAFAEGWAEYASGLAGEMGMYGEPYDRYGRLASEMFLASRLVVDTGMNALGWSREQALDYLRGRLLESDTQLATETLRYSVDIPGQALAYKVGAMAILDLRHHAEEELGDGFDVRRFHQAVLSHGSMPLDVLAEHIEWWIGQERRRLSRPQPR